MAHHDIQPGDRFSITYRTPQNGEGQWHIVGERADPNVAKKLFEDVIADDCAQGAGVGSRCRLCHDRGSEIVRVLDDRTLQRRGLAPSPTLEAG